MASLNRRYLKGVYKCIIIVPRCQLILVVFICSSQVLNVVYIRSKKIQTETCWSQSYQQSYQGVTPIPRCDNLGFVDQPKNLICAVFLLLFISRKAYTQPLSCLTDTNIAALTFAMKSCLDLCNEMPYSCQGRPRSWLPSAKCKWHW